jgi:uncharacterized protein (DUF58 family)
LPRLLTLPSLLLLLLLLLWLLLASALLDVLLVKLGGRHRITRFSPAHSICVAPRPARGSPIRLLGCPVHQLPTDAKHHLQWQAVALPFCVRFTLVH